MLESSNPGVVVIQEWWGITTEIQLQAQKIADQGYRVIVPDLYRGKLGVDAEEASHLMSNLDWANAVEDISSAADTLAKDGNGSVGCVGFCMGGALSLASLALVEQLDCAASFYGVPEKVFADMSTVSKPVQGHFGELDQMAGFSDTAAAEALGAALTAAGSNHEIYRYPNVGHAFMNDTPEAIARKEELGQTGGDSGAMHDPAAVELAWGRLFEFLQKHLHASASASSSY